MTTISPQGLDEETPPPSQDGEKSAVGSTRAWLNATFSSLSLKDYRVLWVLTIWSHTGFFMILTVQGLVAFALTGNNRSVGFVTFGQGLTMLLLTPVGGAIADRLSKRFLVVATNLGFIPTLALVAFLEITGNLTIEFLVLNAVVVGAMNAFFIPARTAYVGDLVPRDQLGNAIAISQVGLNASRILGPFLASALLLFEALGYGGVYAAVAVFYGLIALQALRLPSPPRIEKPKRAVLTEIRLGIKHVGENPRLLPLVAGFIAIFAISLPYMVVLPALTKEVLKESDQAYGLVVGLTAVGGLTVTLLLAGVVDSPKAHLVLHLASAGLGGTLFLMGLVPNLAVLLVIALMLGSFSSGFQVVSNALAMKEARPEYYGRVQSLIMLAFSLVNITALPVGWLADQIGERAVLRLLGIGVLAISAMLLAWVSRAKRLESAAA